MRTLYANGWVVTMDDSGAEHPGGWVLVEDGATGRRGGGERGGLAGILLDRDLGAQADQLLHGFGKPTPTIMTRAFRLSCAQFAAL